MPQLILVLAVAARTAALSQKWLQLPEFDLNPGTFTRRDAASAAALSAAAPVAASAAQKTASRRAGDIQQWPRIPVWPSWAGGRVIPMGLPNADPFLLVAHHKHWFDPRDPLRGPFRAFGKATGLPYIDVEVESCVEINHYGESIASMAWDVRNVISTQGFSMHPHRGFDILTYVLDGSDGFRHRDSLGGSKTYRGGSAQWMRCGAGAQHEEFVPVWKTPWRGTVIKFDFHTGSGKQIWINLPASQKFDPPSIRYLGAAHGAPWHEEVVDGGTRVRTVLDEAIIAAASSDSTGATPNQRPRAEVLHAHIPAGGSWTPRVGADSSCSLYCREGQVSVPGPAGMVTVKAGESCGFSASGAETITCANAARGESDVLLLVGERLREPVAMGGPIVMNYDWEIDEAYRELQAGTFLKRRKS